MAIKNNNMSKIPNYDPSHFDHLRWPGQDFLKFANSDLLKFLKNIYLPRKSLRSLVREGNSVTELRIGYKVRGRSRLYKYTFNKSI